MTGARGYLLLEALVALTILAAVAVAGLGAVAQGIRGFSHARVLEAQMDSADALLSATRLWSRTELLQRLGDRNQGTLRLAISASGPALYRLEVTTLDGTALLETELYRPVPGAPR